MKHNQEKQGPGSIRVYRWLRFILIPAVILMMGVSAFMTVRILLDYRKSSMSYRSIDEQFVLPPKTTAPYEADVMHEQTIAPELPTYEPPVGAEDGTPAFTDAELQPNETSIPTEIPVTPLPETAPIGVDFAGLKQMNSECIGWIYIPDTVVSYPVMHTKNNSKYLDMLPDGTSNKAGSIFMDFRCDEALSDRNTIVYGHNIQNGSMFAVFEKYERRSFFDAHRTVYYLTPDGDYKITVFACMTVSATGEAYDLYEDAESLHSYLRSALNKSRVSSSIDVDRIDRIFTFSTCTGKYGTRIVLLGVPERLS